MIYYVDANKGKDTNPGTAAAPFATISIAAATAVAGDTVIVRAGTYRETVKPKNPGTPSAPILYQAAPGELAIISGTQILQGFTKVSAGVFQVPSPKSLGPGADQIFYDNFMLIEGRWPKIGPDIMHPVMAIATAGNQLAGTTGRLDAPKVPAGLIGAYVNLSPGDQWVFQTGKINASSAGSVGFEVDPSAPFYGQFQFGNAQVCEKGNPFYVWGSPSLCTDPGEWCHDAANLTIRTPDGQDIAGHIVEFKQRQYGIDLSALSYIQIQGIGLFACGVLTDSNTNHCTLQLATCEYLSHFQYIKNGWSDGSLDTGVVLQGNGNTLTASTLQYSAGNLVSLAGSQNTLSKLQLRYANYAGTDCGAVYMIGKNHTVASNTMKVAGRSLIVHRNTTGCVISLNVLESYGTMTKDCGATYTDNNDGQQGQICYNNVSGAEAGGVCGDIYLDNKSKNYHVFDNITSGGKIGVQINAPNSGHLVERNTIDAKSLGIYAWPEDATYPTTGTTVQNNASTKPITVKNGAVIGQNYVGSLLHIPLGFGAEMPAGQTPGALPTKDPSQLILAQHADVINGPTPYKQSLGHIFDGMWIMFSAMEFGLAGAFSTFVAKIAVPMKWADQKIEVRFDSPAGPLIGTLITAPTPSWDDYTLQPLKLSQLIGIHDVYLVFRGHAVCNIESIQFQK